MVKGATVVIPLQNVANQRLSVVLDKQNCVIRVYQRGEYVYLDLMADSKVIINGSMCVVNHNLVTNNSPYFKGALFFADVAGANGRPFYEDFNTRFLLCYSKQ